MSASLSIEDLKLHLNINNDADDALLLAKIGAAEAWVSSYCGGDFDEIPEPVTEATRQLAAHLYENREASLIGVSATDLPFGLLDLLAPYRSWAF